MSQDGQSYHIEGLVIIKMRSNAKPFIEIKDTVIGLSWSTLLKGKLLSKIYINTAHIRFLEAKKDVNDQLKVKEEDQKYWLDSFHALVPLSVQSLELESVSMEFENSNLKGLEKNNLYITVARAQNLIVYKSKDSNLSPVSIEGIVNDHAKIKITGAINLNSSPNFYDVDLKVLKFKLKSANKLLKYYVPLDVTSGDLTLIGEFKGTPEKARGYLRTYFYNLDIIATDQDYKSGEHLIYEWLGGFSTWLLKAVGDGNLATEIPFEVERKELSIDSSEAFWNSLENAFDKMPMDFKDL